MFNLFIKFLNHYANSFHAFSSLNEGDKVHIVAPSGKPNVSYFPDTEKYIRSINLEPYIDSIVCDKDNNPFYSNSDQLRAKDLIDALTDDSKVVWCYRGGAGANRLIPYLEEQLPSVLPKKIFIGYSDATVLHLYLQNKYGWSTIHGPMLGQIVTGYNDPDSVSKLEEIIFSRVDSIDYEHLTMISNKSDFHDSVISGCIVGGNLTLLESSIGTDWQVDADNRILFMEDVGEPAYSLERSLEHMKQAHLFDNVKAVIFGDFKGSDPTLLQYVENKFADEADFPVFTISGIGHNRENNPLMLNSPASIQLSYDESWKLQIDNLIAI